MDFYEAVELFWVGPEIYVEIIIPPARSARTPLGITARTRWQMGGRFATHAKPPNELGLTCTGGSERAYLDGSCVGAVPNPGPVRSKSRLPETAHGKRPGRASFLNERPTGLVSCNGLLKTHTPKVDLAARLSFFFLLRRLGAPFPLRSHWGQ